MTQRQVRAGEDVIRRLANRSAVAAVAELVWNALDAEATLVEVDLDLNDLDGVERVVVRDNGTGMTRAEAEEHFTVYGESWKKETKFSPNIKRPMHGHLGRGRFTAYALGSKVRWTTAAKNAEGEVVSCTIDGHSLKPDWYDFDEEAATGETTGTVVTVNTQQNQKAAALTTGGAAPKLTALLAQSLLGMPDVKVTYNNVPLDPQRYIERTESIELELDDNDLGGRAKPNLDVVVWNRDMSSKRLFCCDSAGAVVTDIKPSGDPSTHFSWSAYLRWDGFADPNLTQEPDLHNPTFSHQPAISAAEAALANFLGEETTRQRGQLIAQWKEEGVYPYSAAPRGSAEEVEREIFDVVAVVASSAIKSAPRVSKQMTLKLLQETVRSEPSRTRRVLEAVMQLKDEDKEILASLLDRTELSSIIEMAGTVTGRLDFIRAFSDHLYESATAKEFREVDQLHPLLLRELWIFGDEWELSTSESALATVVKGAFEQTGDIEYRSRPVMLGDGDASRKRVDLVFSRHFSESESTRNLVVELKRPGALSLAHLMQVQGYAAAITGDARVQDTSSRWDFVLVGTKIGEDLRATKQVGMDQDLYSVTANYRLYVLTWARLIERAQQRVEGLREALDLEVDADHGRSYLHEKHGDLIPGSESL